MTIFQVKNQVYMLMSYNWIENNKIILNLLIL